MSKERRREVSSKGGKTVHAAGRAHRFTSEDARAAGYKGGRASHDRGNAHQFTPEERSFGGRMAWLSRKRDEEEAP